MGNLLADSISGVPHLAAFDDIAAQRYPALDLSPLLINMIDTVPAVALPYLAETFDMLGYKGWKFADTETKQRYLLKKAIEMHRHIGTPWAIKEALRTLNIQNCTIIEGYHLQYDDEAFYDGIFTYGVGSWADFRVQIDASNFTVINQSLITDLTGIINEWKNVRSQLVDISFTYDQVDNLSPTDVIGMTVEHPADHSLDFSLTF